jgi:hypothetical protein
MSPDMTAVAVTAGWVIPGAVIFWAWPRIYTARARRRHHGPRSQPALTRRERRAWKAITGACGDLDAEGDQIAARAWRRAR